MTTLVNRGSHITGEYLTAPAGDQPIFTPEQLSDEQRMIAQTGLSFITGQVLYVGVGLTAILARPPQAQEEES